MCRFLSVLILPSGEVLHHPMLDSHSDLVTYFDLRDDTPHRQHFAKAELTPSETTWLDPDRWTWQLDEPTRPDWLTVDIEQDAARRTRDLARRMVIATGTRTLVVDGCWIVGGSAIVNDVRAGRILRVQDSASIHDVGDSASIRNVGDSAVLDASAKAHVRTDPEVTP